MSYSFNIVAASKDQAKAALPAKFDEVIATQSIHKRDRDAAIANAVAAIDLLTDAAPEGCSVSVNCSGYVGWQENLHDDVPLTSASISSSASYFKP